jgi:DNA-binding transcriptional ArsR family regulator
MTNKKEHSLRSDGGTDTRNGSNVLETFFGGDVGGGIEESEVFHILGNDRRREIICTLARENDELTVSDLARGIADIEEDLDSSKNLYKSVYVSLQQTHLPKLAKKDIVVYDKDAQTVRPGPAFPQIQRYLHESESRLSQARVLLPLLLSALGLAVALGTTMQVPVIQHVGPLVAGGIFFVLMVVLVLSPRF